MFRRPSGATRCCYPSATDQAVCCSRNSYNAWSVGCIQYHQGHARGMPAWDCHLVSTLLILRPVLKQTALTLWQKIKEGHKTRYGTATALLNRYMDEFVWEKVYEGNALCHLSAQIAEHYPPPRSYFWKCGLIYRLLIGLPYDRPIFGKYLI